MRGEKETECDNTLVPFRLPSKRHKRWGVRHKWGRKSNHTVYQGSVPSRDKKTAIFKQIFTKRVAAFAEPEAGAPRQDKHQQLFSN